MGKAGLQLILIRSFGLFEWELQRDASLAVVRTIAVNAVVTIVSFYLLNCRSLNQSFSGSEYSAMHG